MNEIFSDGLDFLIKSHISVAEEYELKNVVNSELRRAFRKLAEAADAKGISYYRKTDDLKKEINELEKELNAKINKLDRVFGRPYARYLEHRDVLSICVACPYILPREIIYEFFRRGLKEQLY